ncbi:invasion associated locus B family protein [Brucella sp. HL-2]|nr:invasion associated locus B family protein [Brucella sp. HL-2]MCV9907631.1 invasion associated locus B family protein [Brucella sp. HL-2]
MNNPRFNKLIFILFAFSLFGSFPAAGQGTGSRYFLKPSDVQVPKGVEWGQMKRTIQPFENWTLICDENLKLKEKTCNVSQIVTDRSGSQIFSWSLAATKYGEPFMLLRVPSTVDQKVPITVSFPERSKPVLLSYKGCDDSVCLALLPVGPITRENIDKESNVKVAFSNAEQGAVEIIVPLKGLKIALNAIK